MCRLSKHTLPWYCVELRLVLFLGTVASTVNVRQHMFIEVHISWE